MGILDSGNTNRGTVNHISKKRVLESDLKQNSVTFCFMEDWEAWELAFGKRIILQGNG